MSWLQIKKVLILKHCLLLFYATTTNYFLIRLRRVTKSGFYMTTGNDQLSGWPRRSSKALSKAKLAPEKAHGRDWRSSTRLIYYSFLNPGKTITPEKYAQWIDKMPPKLQCLQPALINNMTPILPHDDAQLHVAQQMLQKLNALGCEVLPHLPYSPDLLPTDYHFFQHLDNFLQGKCFHKPQEAENTFYEFVDSKSMDFYATGINKLISHWQKWVDCNGSYFD